MKVFHISHTDLDGYACQFVANHYIKIDGFYNSNYGKEIDEKFKQILKEIGNEEALVLITDLNLTYMQSLSFEKMIEGKKIKLILLDHHKSGFDCERGFSWYYLDDSRCATKITYDFFAKMFGENEKLSKFVDVVNAVDIWLDDDPNFELGKVCMGMVSTSKEVSKILFDKEHTEYVFYLLEKMGEFCGGEMAHIALDNKTHEIKKGFFRREKDDTLANLVSAYVVELLSANAKRFTIEYNGYLGVLTHNVGNVSVIGNDFLTKNEEFDFFVDITSKKTMSFRSNDKLDVANMARDLLGGGGHANASGAFFTNFKDAYDYESIRAQVVDLIKSKMSYFS